MKVSDQQGPKEGRLTPLTRGMKGGGSGFP